MRLLRVVAFFCLVSVARAFDTELFFDRLDQLLTLSAVENTLRARVSGTLDLEYYHFSQPAPGLINSQGDNLFNARLNLFLDAQLGANIYFFAQSRIDRGFDPTDGGLNIRLDEYAVRFTPWSDARFTLQLGKFATVVGNWVPRHLSWDNPFVNAPLPYENIVPIEDKAAPRSPRDFIAGFQPQEKYEFNPVIWGPSYATGLSVSGRLGIFDYAAEMKNSSLSSRPESWDLAETGFDRPTFSSRLGFRPNQMWNFGFSASEGPYFREEAARTLPAGTGLGDFREHLLGQDVSFAWRHLQLWAEFYEVRFDVPRIGDADTFAYYVEGKYKITPQLFGAVRWNEQVFSTIDKFGGDSHWGKDLSRIDAALGYRFTPYTQLKVQYSFEQETVSPHSDNHIATAQVTVRF